MAVQLEIIGAQLNIVGAGFVLIVAGLGLIWVTSFNTGIKISISRSGVEFGEREAVPASIRRQRRIERLKTSLQESADLLTELERDISTGHAQALEIEERIRHNTVLADLSDEQAGAVRDEMADVVRKSDRRSFWEQLVVQIVLGAVFFGLGVAATVTLS